MSIPVYFRSEDISYRLRDIRKIRVWLNHLVEAEGYELGEIYITFLSDDGLLDVNRQYLDHDYYTDIITFPYQNEGEPIHSDIFISVDRARDNGKNFQTGFSNEMHRLLTHGLLHLCGYEDHSDEEKAIMRAKEDKYLSLRSEFGFGS